MKSYVIHLIRNMPCEGNLEGRYIGRTESPLALESIAKLAQRKRELAYPQAQAFFAGVDYLRFAGLFDQITKGEAEALIAAWVTGERTALSVVRPKGA